MNTLLFDFYLSQTKNNFGYKDMADPKLDGFVNRACGDEERVVFVVVTRQNLVGVSHDCERRAWCCATRGEREQFKMIRKRENKTKSNGREKNSSKHINVFFSGRRAGAGFEEFQKRTISRKKYL